MSPRPVIQNTFLNAMKRHHVLHIKKNTAYQRATRGNKRYTNYHSYRKMGGRSWRAFTNKPPKTV